MAQIFVSKEGAVGKIVLSNPDKYNAMTLEMWQALPKAVAAFDADSSVRVIVIEGEGKKAFCSGSDVSQFESRRTGPEEQAYYNRAVEDAHLASTRCSKPVAAKIRGICYGGGMGFASSCDIRMSASTARFRIPAARIGIGYPAVGISRLLPLLGPQRTGDILFSARTFDAREAHEIGFIASVHEEERLDAEVQEWTKLVAENAPLTIRAIKSALVHLATKPGVPLPPEVEGQIGACFSSEDYREGTRAFREKRIPEFKGL